MPFNFKEYKLALVAWVQPEDFFCEDFSMNFICQGKLQGCFIARVGGELFNSSVPKLWKFEVSAIRCLALIYNRSRFLVGSLCQQDGRENLFFSCKSIYCHVGKGSKIDKGRNAKEEHGRFSPPLHLLENHSSLPSRNTVWIIFIATVSFKKPNQTCPLELILVASFTSQLCILAEEERHIQSRQTTG